MLCGKVYFTVRKMKIEQLVKSSPQKIFLISLFLYVISPRRFQLLQNPQVLLQSELSEQAQHGGCNDMITQGLLGKKCCALIMLKALRSLQEGITTAHNDGPLHMRKYESSVKG